MRSEEVPVLVVGAGPVGLSTAVFLAHWGVRTLVIDKRDPTTAPPRAGVSVRTLELFRSVGLGPAIERIAWRAAPPMRTVFKDSAFGTTQHRGGLPRQYEERLTTCGPIDPRLQLTQVEVQRLALEYLAGTDSDVRFGVRLLDFDAGETGVRARTTAGEITARYMVGADGANSEVRDALGITAPDRAVVARLNTAFFRADLGDVMARWDTHACLVRNADVYATLFSKNGKDLWSSHIMDYPGKPDELTDLSEDRTVTLLHAAIGDDRIPVELHAVNAWEAAVGLASAFRRGRVFLAGDAAHVQSSAGGLGMNTGIQDGHNLAWKLATVLDGQAAPRLLDTYEPERRAAAEVSVKLSRRMHDGYREQADDLYEQVAIDYLRAMMFYGYQYEYDDVLTDMVQPGCRFPHHWVTPDVSTLDLIGTQWTVMTGHQQWLVAAAEVGIQSAHKLDGGLPGLGLDGAALVRPDGFVAWCTPNLEPTTVLRDALARARS